MIVISTKENNSGLMSIADWHISTPVSVINQARGLRRELFFFMKIRTKSRNIQTPVYLSVKSAGNPQALNRRKRMISGIHAQ